MIERFEKQLQIGSWVLIAVFALAAAWLFRGIDTMKSPGEAADSLYVSGTGKVTAVPDIAVADISINVEAATAATAQNDANKKSNAVVAYLKNAGIDSKDIRTSGYSIYPQYDYIDGRSRIRGYQVTQSLTVKVRDLDKANTIIDGVVDAGANQVSQVRFEIDDLEALKNEARSKAIADAKKKASMLASQLGVRLDGVISFSESSDTYPIVYGRGGGMDMPIKAEIAGVPAPDLPVGENEISVSVSVTYRIK